MARNNDIKQYVVFGIGYQIKQQIEFRVQVIIYNEYELFLADLLRYVFVNSIIGYLQN